MKLAIAAFALASALDAATFGFVTTPANGAVMSASWACCSAACTAARA